MKLPSGLIPKFHKRPLDRLERVAGYALVVLSQNATSVKIELGALPDWLARDKSTCAGVHVNRKRTRATVYLDEGRMQEANYDPEFVLLHELAHVALIGFRLRGPREEALADIIGFLLWRSRPAGRKRVSDG